MGNAQVKEMFEIFGRKKPDRKRSAAIYNEIGEALVEQVGQPAAKILLYAEIVCTEVDHDYGVDYFIRFATKDAAKVQSLPVEYRLATAVYELFVFLKGSGKEHVWKSMEYVVEQGKVDVALSYDAPDFGDELEFWERAPKITEKHFGARKLQ